MFNLRVLKFSFLRFMSKGILYYEDDLAEKNKVQLLNAVAFLLNCLNIITLIPYFLIGLYWQILLVSLMIVSIFYLSLLLKRKNTFLKVKFWGFQTVIIFIFLSSAVHGYTLVFNQFYLILLASIPFVFSSSEKKYLFILIGESVVLYFVQILFGESYLINFKLLPKEKESSYIILMLINMFSYLFGLSYLSVVTKQYMTNKLKKVSSNLYSAKNLLSQQNHELQTFGMAATHSLKTPLFIINSFLNKIKENVQSNENTTMTKYYLNLLRESNKLNEKYSNDLISYSSIYTISSNFKKINLKKLVDKSCSILLLKYKNATIENNIHDITLYSPELPLNIIIENLVDNGLKYNQSEIPQVKIYGKKTIDKTVILFVEDNGIGIRDDYKERIFEPFNRINDIETSLGSGLGLAIARLAALKINASLELFSSNQNGSIFKLIIKNVH